MILPSLHPDSDYHQVIIAFMDEFGWSKEYAKAYLKGAIAAGEFSWTDLIEGRLSPGWIPTDYPTGA